MSGCQAIGIGHIVGFGYLDYGHSHPDHGTMKKVFVMLWNAENNLNASYRYSTRLLKNGYATTSVEAVLLQSTIYRSTLLKNLITKDIDE